MGNTARRVAGYVRVSSTSQTDAMQRAAIERAAFARGDEVATWFADRMTGGTMARPELARCRQEVRAGAVGRLYVYRLDRLTRTGIRDTLEIVDELGRHGCELVTVADGFDVQGPAGEIVLAVMAWCAKAERSAINERISAARTRVESTGGRWGRPRKLTRAQVAQIHELADQGATVRAIAAAMGLPRSTVHEQLQALSAGEGPEACPENMPRTPSRNH